MFDTTEFYAQLDKIECAQRTINDAMEKICGMLNELMDSLPDCVFSADDDTTVLRGFYVDEDFRLRFETDHRK